MRYTSSWATVGDAGPEAAKQGISDHIDKMGRNGWELVSTTSCGERNKLIFFFWKWNPTPEEDAKTWPK